MDGVVKEFETEFLLHRIERFPVNGMEKSLRTKTKHLCTKKGSQWYFLDKSNPDDLVYKVR